MAYGTPLSYYRAHRRLLELIARDFADVTDPVDLALRSYWIRKRRRAEAKRIGRYPGPGNSETIMRNRVLRAQSMGLEHDGRYGGR